MQIQINTDHNIEGREALERRVATDVKTALSRFGDRITRVEVHLSDENGAKPGAADKRCVMEARLAGREPVAASHDAATLQSAFDGAAKKLQHLLESTLGRVRDHKGEESIRTESAFE